MPGNATTYFVRLSSATAENVYRKSGYVLGIRARGAMGGREHVERERACDKAETSPHRLKPGCGANTYGTTKVAPSRIVNPAGLSRERQVEVCAQCHGGIGESVGAFSYVKKCQECHKDSDCGEFAKLGARIRDNCIDCHMPVQGVEPDHSHLNGKEIKARMRNHWIKPYSAPGN